MKILGLSKRGSKEINEDCYVIDNKCFYNENIYLNNASNIFVFDGVSSSVDGKSASLFAAKIIASDSERLVQYSANEINQLLKNINDKILTENIGSTTIAGISIIGSNLRVINIGDSKVYRVREGIIRKLSVDDTYYEYLKAINDKNASLYKDSHIITSCLGMENFVVNNIHVKEIDFGIMEKDILLICSDGVSDLLSEQEILNILENNDLLEIKLNNIEEIIISRGMHDNYTLVIMEV